jgi:hypothetical protein
VREKRGVESGLISEFGLVDAYTQVAPQALHSSHTLWLLISYISHFVLLVKTHTYRSYYTLYTSQPKQLTAAATAVAVAQA